MSRFIFAMLIFGDAMPNISPIGDAIHNDFYAVSGSGLPSNVRLIFDTPSGSVTVTPDFVRPHVAFLAQLPPTVPAGTTSLRLQGPTWTSDSVPSRSTDPTSNNTCNLFRCPKVEPIHNCIRCRSCDRGGVWRLIGRSDSNKPYRIPATHRTVYEICLP